MSSSAKTEKPTDKKKRDASKRGQSWRSQDLVTLLVLFGGACLIRYAFPMVDLMRHFLKHAETGFHIALADYAAQLLSIWAGACAAIIVLVVILASVPNLLMSRFRLASEIIKLDFAVLNPISGLKKIFSVRTIKDGFKACLHLAAFVAAGMLFWHTHRQQILGLARLAPASSMRLLGELAFSLVVMLLGATLLLTLLDTLLEYLLYIRDLKMTRDEVKREYKDQFGKPEIKQEQRRLGHELLSGETLGNVEQSNFVLANPTHIAIGIYINPAISQLPFISVMETNERAQAVIAHARKVGVPVVRNVSVARRIFKEHKRYTFVSEYFLDDIAQVLMWLMDVEKSRRAQYEASAPAEDTPPAAPARDG